MLYTSIQTFQEDLFGLTLSTGEMAKIVRKTLPRESSAHLPEGQKQPCSSLPPTLLRLPSWNGCVVELRAAIG